MTGPLTGPASRNERGGPRLGAIVEAQKGAQRSELFVTLVYVALDGDAPTVRWAREEEVLFGELPWLSDRRIRTNPAQ